MKVGQKIIISVISLSLLYSCGSSEKQNIKKSDKEKIPIGVNNQDFVPPEPIVFSSSSDKFGEDFTESGSLSPESMDKAPVEELSHFDNVNSQLDQALSYCYRKKFVNASAIFDQLYKKYKRHPVYWNQIGTCEFIKGSHRKALLFYNKARDLSPSYAPPFNNLGVLYQIDGKDQKALAAYEKASKIGNFSLTPLFNLGQIYAKYGLRQEAKNIFKTLYQKDRKDEDVIAALAYVYLLEGNYKKSVSLYNKMDRQSYRGVRVGVNLSLALYLDGRRRDAKGVWGDIKVTKNKELKKYYKKAARFFGGKL